jgi:AraC-like DNA-binding protein
VSFHSYAIPNFFNIPSTELNKEFIPLTTFLGYEGEILKERIALATGTKQRIKILSDYFISALEKNNYGDKQITAAINEIKRYNGSIKIEELASDFSLSQKQFGRRFKEFSGFSPKMYSRIIRFESVIKNYQNISNITKIAFTDGYYDQAHFIHEVKSFTGYSPKDFWKLSDENS